MTLGITNWLCVTSTGLLVAFVPWWLFSDRPRSVMLHRFLCGLMKTKWRDHGSVSACFPIWWGMLESWTRKMCLADIPDETVNDKHEWLRGNLKAAMNEEERSWEDKHKQLVLISAVRCLRMQLYLRSALIWRNLGIRRLVEVSIGCNLLRKIPEAPPLEMNTTMWKLIWFLLHCMPLQTIWPEDEGVMR